jgi:hypothetical protein
MTGGGQFQTLSGVGWADDRRRASISAEAAGAVWTEARGNAPGARLVSSRHRARAVRASARSAVNGRGEAGKRRAGTARCAHRAGKTVKE